MKYVYIVLGAIAAFFAAFGYREKAKRQKLEADLAEAESESLSRQSEAALVRQREADENIQKSGDRNFATDDINELFNGD